MKKLTSKTKFQLGSAAILLLFCGKSDGERERWMMLHRKMREREVGKMSVGEEGFLSVWEIVVETIFC